MPQREHTFEYTKSKDTKGTVVYIPVPDEDDPDAPVAAKTIYFQKEFFDKDKKNWPEKMTITVSFKL
jgi:hypothetical protein